MNFEKKSSYCCDSSNSEQPVGAKSNNERVVNAATSNGCSLFSSSHEALKARVWVTSEELRWRADGYLHGSKLQRDFRDLAYRMNVKCIKATATEQEMLHLLDDADKLRCRCEIVGLDWFAHRVEAWQDSPAGVFTLHYNPYGENEWSANQADAWRLGIEPELTTAPAHLAPQSYNPQGGDKVQVLYYKYRTESGIVKLIIAFPYVLRKP